MPSKQLKLHVLDGSNPQAQYDAIVSKDSETFYILSSGKLYYGDTVAGEPNNVVILNTAGTYSSYIAGKLYVVTATGVKINGDTTNDATKGVYLATSSSVLSLITGDTFAADMTNFIANTVIHSDDNSLDEDFAGSDTTLMTSKAVADYVGAVLNDVSILSSSFFRTVESHTITQQEITDGDISIPQGTQAGDIGLLFTRDTDMTDDGDEEQFFINLQGYIDIYTGGTTDSITVTVDNSNEITADLNIKTGEKFLKIDDTNGGVYINATNSIDDSDASDEKLVTEEALVDYITTVLADYVRYNFDSGTPSNP